MENLFEKAFAFSIITAALVLQANAAETDAKPATVVLDQVTVTATKIPIKVEEVPANVSITTSDDIRAKASATDAYKAIKHMAGVESVGGGMSETMYIRGKTPSVLSNGRDMNFFSGMTNDPSVSMSSIERIEVLKGPQAAIHGAKAVSGVVNIIRKKGDVDNPFIETGIFAGTDKQFGTNLSLGGGNNFNSGNSLTYFLDLGTAKRDKYKTPKGTIPYTEKDQKNIFARVDYAFADSHEISLDFAQDKSDKTQGWYGTYYNQNDWSNIYNNKYDTKSGFLTYEGKYNEIFSLYSNIGLVKRTFDMIYGSNTKPEEFFAKKVHTVYKEKALQGEIRGTVNWLEDNKLKNMIGLQYKKTDIQSRYFKYGTLDLNRNSDKTEKNISPFAQIEYKPIPYALFVAGIRHDSYNTAGKKMKNTSPNIGISIFPFANTDYDYTTLWAGYSKAFNTPTAPQRYLPKFLGGNPDLNPEKSKGYEIGLKQRFGDWGNFEASYYNTDYTDQIRLILLPNNEWLFYNEGKSKVRGYEISGEFYPTDWLILNLAYTNEKTKNAEGKRLYGAPDKSLKYGATIMDLAGFDFSIQASNYLDIKFNDGKKHPSQNKTIVDIKLGYKYEINGFSLMPFIEVENLTDKLYYSLGGEPSINEGRNWRAGLNIKYNF